MAHNEMGKRYSCGVCGAEVIVTRLSQGQKEALACHGQPMAKK